MFPFRARVTTIAAACEAVLASWALSALGNGGVRGIAKVPSGTRNARNLALVRLVLAPRASLAGAWASTKLRLEFPWWTWHAIKRAFLNDGLLRGIALLQFLQ